MTEIFLKSWFYLIFPANKKCREPSLRKYGKKLDQNILAFEQLFIFILEHCAFVD